MKIEFHRETVAKAVGSLARELGGGRGRGSSRKTAAAARRRGEPFGVQGLLVNERFTKRLMSPDDVDEYTLVRKKEREREHERREGREGREAGNGGIVLWSHGEMF